MPDPDRYPLQANEKDDEVSVEFTQKFQYAVQHRNSDPDRHQNDADPQHCLKQCTINYSQYQGLEEKMSARGVR